MEKTARTMFEANHLVLLLIIFSLIGFGFVQSTCPVNCTSCYNSGACYICVEGYFGLSCDKKCHEMCLNKTCHKDDGICTYGCQEGYFDTGSLCSKCNVYCKTCTQTSINCLECKEGNYGPACQYSCSHCTDGICTRDNCTYGCVDGFLIGREACISCSASCTSCSDTFDNCHNCVDGYFGPACQFLCNECSHCNKEDGLCLTTKKVHPPIIITQKTSPSKETTALLFTTRIATTTSTNTSQYITTKIGTTTSTTTSQSMTNTDSKIQKQNQEDPSLDNKTIISAAAGGGGGLVVIVFVVIVVIVCKRRRKGKQSDTLAENINMTDNENYISAEDIDESIRNSTNEHTKKNEKEMENNDDLYSLPNKKHRSTVVTMETISDERPDNSKTLIPSKLPVKRNVHSDII